MKERLEGTRKWPIAKGISCHIGFTLPGHACVLQTRVSLRGKGQWLPPHAGFRLIEPSRYRVPPPQLDEQLYHEPHVTTQFTLRHILPRRCILPPSVWSSVINEKSRAIHSSRDILIALTQPRVAVYVD